MSAATDATALLVLEAGPRRLALPLETVRETTRALPWTRIPGAPPGVLGVLALRGEVLTVLDLEGILDPHAAPDAALDGRPHRFVVASVDGEAVALPVDAMPEVVRTAPDAGAPVPAGLPAALAATVSEVRDVDGALLPVLALDGRIDRLQATPDESAPSTGDRS